MFGSDALAIDFYCRMNKLDTPPVDYIHHVFLADHVTVAISIRGEVVVYSEDRRIASVQVGEVRSATLAGTKLYTINSSAVTKLDISTLDLESTPLGTTGGEHIVSEGDFIIIVNSDSTALVVFQNEKEIQQITADGIISNVAVCEDTLLVCIINNSASSSATATTSVSNRSYKLNKSRGLFELTNTTSPGFGYPLVTQTSLFKSGETIKYIQGSMEGKVSISDIDGKDSFVFRPHRVTLTDKSLFAQPVFALANRGNVLITGGDGVLGVWDINTKKRNSQIKNLNGHVTALAMDADKVVFAVCDAAVKNSDLEVDLHLLPSQLFQMKY